MGRCFVMQPFDGGKFDKRYSETIKPAIANAGFIPYRVDEDPSVEIPIQDIEEGIRDSVICVAEITTNNPNVWFELGYAIASSKPVCLLCSDEREGKFPFDVQHRNIIKYGTASVSDFQKLQEQLTEKLQALHEKSQTLRALNQPQSDQSTEGLANHELAALVSIGADSYAQVEGVSFYSVERDLEAAGFNRLACSLALKSLVDQYMIETATIEDMDGEHQGFRLTNTGLSWLQSNIDRLNLSAKPRSKRLGSQSGYAMPPDDDIPF